MTSSLPSPIRGRVLAWIASLARAAGLASLVLAARCGGNEPGPAPARETAAPRMRYASDGTPAMPVRPIRGTPLVVLICLDTVRADALAPYANGPPAMPETSAWMAATATVFRDAQAPASWTAPSIASLLTGVLPSSHGVRELGDAAHLVPSVVTLAEILATQRFTCGAFTGGGWVSKSAGMLQGFDNPSSPFSFAARANGLVENHKMIAGRGAYFLFLHTYEAHDPYGARATDAGTPTPVRPYAPAELARLDAEVETDGGRALTRLFLLDPASRASVFETAAGGARRLAVIQRWFEQGARSDPKGFASLVAQAKGAYEAGLRRLDHALATYLKGADEAHVLDDAIVVLCADHGEGFGEHDTLHHGRRVYAELTHVPLAIRAPKLPRGKVIEGTCSLLDVMPTILELCGLPEAEGAGGRSLVPLALGHETTGRIAISEERRTKEETGLEVDQTLCAVRDRETTWIGTRERRTGVLTEEIFDRSADPGEARPLPIDETLRRASAAFRAAVDFQRRDGVR